jgi:hypothetical protein
VVVVFQNDATTRLCCANHGGDDFGGALEVFEQKPGVHDVERSPLIVAQREIIGIALANLGATGGSEALPFLDLRRFALDSDYMA